MLEPSSPGDQSSLLKVSSILPFPKSMSLKTKYICSEPNPLRKFCKGKLNMTKTFFHECIFTFFSSNTNIIVFCSQLHIWPIIWVGCAWYSSEKLITIWIRSTCTWTFNLRDFYFPSSASCNGKSQSWCSCWPCIFKVYWKRNWSSFSWIE